MKLLETRMPFRRALTAVAIVACFGTGSVWAQGKEAYGPFNLDGGKIACNDDRGPEIKKTQEYKAPPDRFFVEDTISVRGISGWGKKAYCEVSSVSKKPIKAKTDYGEIEIKVIDKFSVFAHADCGSGVVNNSGGKTASIECEVSATMQKYTNQ